SAPRGYAVPWCRRRSTSQQCRCGSQSGSASAWRRFPDRERRAAAARRAAVARSPSQGRSRYPLGAWCAAGHGYRRRGRRWPRAELVDVERLLRFIHDRNHLLAWVGDVISNGEVGDHVALLVGDEGMVGTLELLGDLPSAMRHLILIDAEDVRGRGGRAED